MRDIYKSVYGGCLWVYITVDNGLCNKMSNKVIILITITARETHAAASVKCVLVLHNAIPSLLICYFCFSLCQTNWLDPSEEIHTSVLWQKSKNKQANKYILKKEEIFVYITNHYNPTVIQEHHINEHLLLKKNKNQKVITESDYFSNEMLSPLGGEHRRSWVRWKRPTNNDLQAHQCCTHTHTSTR